MQLGRLVATMPNLAGAPPLLPNALEWLGKLDALLSADNDTANLVTLRAAVAILNKAAYYDRSSPAQDIAIILHRALAAAELRAPVSAQGSFIPAGNAFDAMAAIGKVLETAKRDVLVVDPYMDEKALTDFAPLAAAGVAIRLLADDQDHKPTLRPAQQRWIAQYGTSRPLEVRLAAHRILHDRLIIVDDTDARILTQSLNSFATRSPASIVRVDEELLANSGENSDQMCIDCNGFP